MTVRGETARLTSRADLACRVSVDGEVRGSLRPGDALPVDLVPGTHRVEATPDDGGTAWRSTVEVSGMADPVVQLVDQSNGEIVYTLRIKGTRFRPRVFARGLYTLKVGEPGTGRLKVFKNLNSLSEASSETIRVQF